MQMARRDHALGWAENQSTARFFLHMLNALFKQQQKEVI